MSPPIRQVNTFMKNKSRQLVDSVSRFFILLELLFGVYRISFIRNVGKQWLKLALGYVILLNFIGFGIVIKNISSGFYFLMTVDLVFFICNNFLNFILRKRLQNFYKELNKFNTEIDYELDIERNSIQNLIQMGAEFASSIIIIFGFSSNFSFNMYIFLLQIFPIKMLHALEFHYFGHLFGTISPRIRRIIYCIKVSYPSNESDENSSMDEDFNNYKKRERKLPRKEMEHLMDLYYDLITAYDCLNQAIKWQMLILLILSFTDIFGFSYRMTTKFINQHYLKSDLIIGVAFTILVIGPLLSPCLFGDQTCKEVQLLRETLSHILHENCLDKPSRTAAKAFLMLAKARDLSFSLFHMFNIDISLPFKFLGLLFTYLIILLQFEKVLNPKIN